MHIYHQILFRLSNTTINFEYNKSDKNHVVSQMAHAKNIGEPFMARAKNLYNIPRECVVCIIFIFFIKLIVVVIFSIL